MQQCCRLILTECYKRNPHNGTLTGLVSSKREHVAAEEDGSEYLQSVYKSITCPNDDETDHGS